MYQLIQYLRLLIIMMLVTTIKSYFITVDANAEECFFENLEADTKMSLTFEIVEGGFLDIDVKIMRPDGAIIHRGERQSSGMYTFSAPICGRYTYCFSNQMSILAPKVVKFNVEIVKAPLKKTDDNNKPVDHN